MNFLKSRFTLKLLLSYIFLAIIPLLVFSFVLSYTSFISIRSNIMSYIDLFTEQTSSNIKNYINGLDRMTQISMLDSTLCDILSKPEYTSDSSKYEISSYLQNEALKMQTQHPSILEVTFVDINGLSPYGTSTAINDYRQFNEITHTDGVKNTEEYFYISKAHIPGYSFGDQLPVFTITRILRQNNIPIGAVVITMSCQSFLDAININPSFLDNGARVIIANPDNEIIVDTSLEFSDIENFKDVSVFKFNPDDIGSKKMLFSSKMESFTTYVVINKSQLFKNVEYFNYFVFFFTFFMVAVILVLTVYFVRRLIKPIKILDAATRQYANGNYSMRIQITSVDEIGQLCTSFNFMAEKIQELLEHVFRYELDMKQAQLEVLQNQINPHFLYNTLDSIRMKALINHDRETADMIQKLSQLFRITLSRVNNTVKIADEIEHVDIYLSILNVRFDNRYRLVKNISEDLLHYSIIKLSLQPLVENCIKHGFKGIVKNCEIYISVISQGDNLLIRVSDNGIGIPEKKLLEIQKTLNNPEATQRPQTHIGIVNISNRISLEYGDSYSLKIFNNTPQGTTVELLIPKRVVPDGQDMNI